LILLLQATIIIASPKPQQQQQQPPNVGESGYGSAPTGYGSAAPPPSGYGGQPAPPPSNGTQQPTGYGGSSSTPGFNNGPGYVNPGQNATSSTTPGYGQQQSSTPSYGGTNTTTNTTGTSNTTSTTTCNPLRSNCGGIQALCAQPGQSNNPACAGSTPPSYGQSTSTTQNPNYPSDYQAYGVPGQTPGFPIGPGPSYVDPSQPSTCAQQNPAYNRDLVIKAFQEVYGDRNPANLNTYFAESYIEHDPSSPDGRQGIADTLKNNTNPPQRFPFLRTCADADLVWIHNRVQLQMKTFATVDIYRIECGVIKEHWGVRQDTALPAGEKSKNDHPFF